MQQTIFAILTDKQTRNSHVIETALDQELTAGVPWFNRAVPEPLGALSKNPPLAPAAKKSSKSLNSLGTRYETNPKNITLIS